MSLPTSRLASVATSVAPNHPVKDVLLIGLGAVGVIYAHILALSGRARVTAVARSNYELVKQQGLRIKSKKYGDIHGWRPYRVFPTIHPALDRTYAYVLVCTKAVPEVVDTVEVVRPVVEWHDREREREFNENESGEGGGGASEVKGETDRDSARPRQPTYVFMQNGLGVEKGLVKLLEERRKVRGDKVTDTDIDTDAGGDAKEDVSVVGAALWIGTNIVNDEVVHGDFDRILLGTYPTRKLVNRTSPHDSEQLPRPRDPPSPALRDLGAMLEAGGSTVTLVKDIEVVKFRKNFWNLALASFATLTRHPLPSVFRDPEIEARVRPTLAAILNEAVSVGRALGFPDLPSPSSTSSTSPDTNDTPLDANDYLPTSLIAETLENTARIHRRPDSEHVPSMLLDLREGRPMEVEVVVGEVVRAGRERGVDVPRIETMYAMLVVVQNELLKARGLKV